MEEFWSYGTECLASTIKVICEDVLNALLNIWPSFSYWVDTVRDQPRGLLGSIPALHNTYIHNTAYLHILSPNKLFTYFISCVHVWDFSQSPLMSKSLEAVRSLESRHCQRKPLALLSNSLSMIPKILGDLGNCCSLMNPRNTLKNLEPFGHTGLSRCRSQCSQAAESPQTRLAWQIRIRFNIIVMSKVQDNQKKIYPDLTAVI